MTAEDWARIKKTFPNARWVAKNSDNSVFAYIAEPLRDEAAWACGVWSVFKLNCTSWLGAKFANIPWRQSLVPFPDA